MIERLMNEEFRYGEPGSSKAEGQIAEIYQELRGMLDREGRILLEKLSDAYIRQNNLIVKDVFKSGFCSAVELMIDFLKQNS